MLIKKKKLARKNGVENADVKNILLDNLKSNGHEISFASKGEIEDSLDVLYQDFPASAPGDSFHHSVMSKEEIEQQAHDLIEIKAKELYAQYQEDISTKRAQAETEIAGMLDEAKVNAEAEASEIIAEANSKAEVDRIQIEQETEALEDAKSEFELRVVKETQEAYDEGMTSAEAHIHELVRILSSFNRVKEGIIEEVKPQIMSIAIDVARQILNHEVETNPNLIEEQVTRSVSRLINSKGVMQIFLNPEDVRHADYLETVLSRLLDSSVRLIFVKDEGVNKGSCVVNTQGGRLDASFETQLDLIKVSFEKYLGHKIDELDMLEDSLESDFEELDMSSENIINPNQDVKTDESVEGPFEPSDGDLELLESDPEALIDLDMDPGDLDALLQDMMLDDDDDKDKPEAKLEAEVETFKFDHDDSKDLGANDFSNGGEIDLDAEMSIKKDPDEPEMEEFNEFAEEEAGEEGSDDRFPDY